MVVGAGASAEFGLPTGGQLKEKIANLLGIKFEHYDQISGDRLICAALRWHVSQTKPPSRDINPYLHAAWRICDAMPQARSIDQFIDTHQGDRKLELCGKLAIVRSILEAERNSALFVDPSNRYNALNFGRLTSTWFTSFFQQVFDNCRVDSLADRLKSLTLIVFNYDRCIEHFLYHALQNYFGVGADEAAELVKQLEVFHPYGTVGALPWQSRDDEIGFGETPSAQELYTLSTKIRTFTEGTDPAQSEIKSIKNAIRMSHRILFLGFAYHKLNLDLLRPDSPEKPDMAGKRLFGTARDFSVSDASEIASELGVLSAVPVQNITIRTDLTCAMLFGEYSRSLRLGEG